MPILTRQKLLITVKLFSGLAGQSGIKDHDPRAGTVLNAPKNTTIKKLAKNIKLPKYESLAYFMDGEQVGIQTKLTRNCELVCVKPTAGG